MELEPGQIAPDELKSDNELEGELKPGQYIAPDEYKLYDLSRSDSSGGASKSSSSDSSGCGKSKRDLEIRNCGGIMDINTNNNKKEDKKEEEEDKRDLEMIDKSNYSGGGGNNNVIHININNNKKEEDKKEEEPTIKQQQQKPPLPLIKPQPDEQKSMLFIKVKYVFYTLNLYRFINGRFGCGKRYGEW